MRPFLADERAEILALHPQRIAADLEELEARVGQSDAPDVRELQRRLFPQLEEALQRSSDRLHAGGVA